MLNLTLLKLLAKSKSLLDEKSAPRWLIYLADIGITIFGVILAFLFRFNFEVPDRFYSTVVFTITAYIISRTLFFVSFKIYSHTIRYTSFYDIRKIFITIALNSFAILLFSFLSRHIKPIPVIPYSIIAIEFFISLYFISNLRIYGKQFVNYLSNIESKNKRALIFGSKELAVLAKESIELHPVKKFKVMAFFDAAPLHKKNKLMGLTVYDVNQLETLIQKYNITHLVFAKREDIQEQKEYIAGICNQNDIKMLTVPDSWMEGNINQNQLKEVNLEDILNRKPIKLDLSHINKALENQRILITGAAGSIGSELVRQIVNYSPAQIILIDQAETPIYDIELELKEDYNFKEFQIFLADILNEKRLDSIFAKTAPDIIFHAAAYKHVPVMESNPIEAVRNNIIGTKILADLACKYKVAKFVMVSTDKAVNPTGIMGATKRIAEMYTQSLNTENHTNFITTRFGNVLYSNGSVIPRFLKQIKEGGPVTVTHPEITRYFMTIPEACQLVLEAGVMGIGGEIFLFDMGKAVKILDLAKNLIKLTGHIENEDINIEFTGLRPGEKLYEELLLEAESNRPTHHPKIKIANVVSNSFQEIDEIIGKINTMCEKQNMPEVIHYITQLVPSYKQSVNDK